MWDAHWCAGASRRVAEMAPRLERDHRRTASPRRADHPRAERHARLLRRPSRPQAGAGCAARRDRDPARALGASDPRTRRPLPIDDSDGGCDCRPQCSQGHPWRRQIAAIEIVDGDAITDSAEAFYLMRQRGIENVLIMGVHVNMCVLGRPFGIRQLVLQGMNVALGARSDRRHVQFPHAAVRRSLRRDRAGDRAHRAILVSHDHERSDRRRRNVSLSALTLHPRRMSCKSGALIHRDVRVPLAPDKYDN